MTNHRRILPLPIICICFVVMAAFAQSQTPRPNVVWIMSEDNSADYLRHFDVGGASTPNIESLAAHGVTFDHAFSNAPVCSVARTTLITSCYAPRICTQFHRKTVPAKLPDGLQMFPAYLRQAGYYTTNSSKEDYNARPQDEVWDNSSKKASWTNRPDPSMPFFHVETTAVSHESRLHFPPSDLTNKATQADADSVTLQSYFPDTPMFRYTRARYHDCMASIDEEVGRIVKELAADGQLENTFIFYFGDHGGVLPRSKGYAYESGLHVPLVIRVPENFKSLVDREIPSRTDGFVEFVDFGPTVLRLAGVDAPDGIDGEAFLGDGIVAADVDARNEAFGYADRFDEKYDLIRTLRRGDLKYIRNFEPFYPDGMQNNYRYKMAAYQQWRKMHRDGKLDTTESAFFEPKSPEALYDLENDPGETVNLIDDPAYRDQAAALRSDLMTRLKSMPDLSFFPEAVLVDEAMEEPVAFGQEHRTAIAGYIDVANLQLKPFEQARDQLVAAIGSDDPWMRYWALITATAFGSEATELADVIEKRLVDQEPLVVARACEFIAVAGSLDPRPNLYRSLTRAVSEAEALQIFNTAVYLNDHTDGRFPIDTDQIQLIIRTPKGKSEVANRLDYLRSEQAAGSVAK